MEELILLPHQIEGKDFLIAKQKAMLCDQAGLGKTLQALEAIKEEGLTATIFAPKSLLPQWQSEIEKFSYLTAIIVEGDPAKRKLLYQQPSDIYLQNYEKASRDKDFLSNIDTDCIILDEAQRIKNFSAQRTLAIKEIANCLSPPYKWILTASPMQNNKKELYSLLEFLNGDTITDVIEKLNTRQGGWKNYHYQRPGLTGPPSRRLFLSAISDKSKDQLYRAMKDIMLRRMRDNETPPSVKTYRVDMNPDQARMDRELKHELETQIKDKHFNVTNALALMTRRRQIANTPQLINPNYKKRTPKLREILAIAQDIVSFDEKAIFFSEFRKMIDIVSTMLTEKNIAHAQLTGHPSCKPEIEKDRFRYDPNVHILLGTKSAEEGHNLQEARHIVNIELPYNPERVEQRIGRSDRIGQSDQAIQVINIHSIGSIEERILDIIYEKKVIFDSTINVHNKMIKLDRTTIRQISQ